MRSPTRRRVTKNWEREGDLQRHSSVYVYNLNGNTMAKPVCSRN